jgi:hypothetical protein
VEHCLRKAICFYLRLSHHRPLEYTHYEAPGQSLPDAFHDFARADVSDIQYPAQLKFGEDLEFLGYHLITHRDVERLPLLNFSDSAPNNAVVIGKISVR